MKSKFTRHSNGRIVLLSLAAGLASSTISPAAAQAASDTQNVDPAATPAPAASPATADATQEVGEIVVTALKRAERVQDVPVAVTAIGGAALAKQHITQADDLVTQVPSLQVSGTVGQGAPIFSLRGISMSDFSLNQNPPIAVYYDEVYKGNFAFLGVALYDLERVEVLRGPQGTLYGKNTTGGAVNLIAAKPTYDLGGDISLGYGNYNRYDASGALNVPITSTLAARVAFTYSKADGWQHNAYPGSPALSAVDQYAVRGTLLWEPAAGVSFVLRASTSLQQPLNYGVYSTAGSQGIGAGLYEAFNNTSSFFRTGVPERSVVNAFYTKRHARTSAIALTGNIDLGSGLNLTSVTSWDRGTLSFGEDTAGAPLAVLRSTYADRALQFAQDLRLTSNWSNGFNFILGGYFNREKVDNVNGSAAFTDVDFNGDGQLTNLDCGAGPVPFFGCSVVNSFAQLKKSYAIYSDANYDLGGGFKIRGGLRYTHDTGKQQDLNSQAYGSDGVFATTLIPSTNLNFTGNNLSGKIGLDYKAGRDQLLYANYSRGYRASSFNAQALYQPSDASIARPEKIDAFEIGAKTQWLDRHLTFNASAFYYLYHDQQFISVDPNTNAQALINVPKSRIYGAEFEISYRYDDRFSVHTAIGLLHSRIDQGVVNGGDLAGHRLSNAPTLSWSGVIDWTAYDNGTIKLSAHPSFSYVSSQYFDVQTLDRLRQPGYAQFGGHIDLDRGPFTLSVWAKNLTDKFYYTSTIDAEAGLGFVYHHVGEPRTFGGTVSYRF